LSSVRKQLLAEKAVFIIKRAVSSLKGSFHSAWRVVFACRIAFTLESSFLSLEGRF
jgi:hypothetical protein